MKVKWTLLQHRKPTVGGAMFLIAGVDKRGFRVITASNWDPGAVGPDLTRHVSGAFDIQIRVFAWAPLPAFPSALEKLL